MIIIQIVCLPLKLKGLFDSIAPQIIEICTVAESLPLFLKYYAKHLFFQLVNPR